MAIRLLGSDRILNVGAGKEFYNPWSAIKYLAGLSFDDFWELIYESGSETVDIPLGSTTVSENAASTVFEDYLGDVWLAAGTSGFTPDKLYQVEAINSDTEILLTHPWCETAISGGEYKLYRPKRYTILVYPGLYEQDIASQPLTVPMCLSVQGVSIDAQWFYEHTTTPLAGPIRPHMNSGQITVRDMTMGMSFNRAASGIGLSVVRAESAEEVITDYEISRCRISAPYCDTLTSSGGAGTVILRNNVGILGFDGLAGIISPDKLDCHSNTIRNTATEDITHGKTMIGVLARKRDAAGTIPVCRNIFIHNNVAEIDQKDTTGVAVGVAITNDDTTTAHLANSKIVTAHNYITCNSESTATEVHGILPRNFAIGIYATSKGVATAGTTPIVESYGDIINVTGAGHLYGYGASGGKVNIWKRPDSLAVVKDNGGLIDDDGVGI